MRVDYVLPSTDFDVVRSGVFWPPPEHPEAQWLKASDHRMVWVDLRLAGTAN
jgi:endonuclease/exonuclease/phosphatase family metal-dependent hydrolase